jgi:hypothetical protein
VGIEFIPVPGPGCRVGTQHVLGWTRLGPVVLDGGMPKQLDPNAKVDWAPGR